MKFLAYAESTNDEEYHETVSVRLAVHVFDIDQSQKTAEVQIHVFIRDFPDDFASMQLSITGGGYVYVSCNKTGRGISGWYYQGKSNQVKWLLEGFGENFPFDSYKLGFIVYDLTSVGNNFSMISEKHQASFDGPKAYFLKDIWLLGDEDLVSIGYVGMTEVYFAIQRTFNALAINILQFLIPIISCYYLLGGTLMLNPKAQLAERLGIYLSLFVFVPTFFIAIQGFLPYRSSFSFPEFLLTNLILSNTIFGICSMIGNSTSSDVVVVRLCQPKGVPNKWDRIGIIFSLIFSAMVYLSTIIWKVNLPIATIFSWFVLPSYIFAPFLIAPGLRTKRNVSVILIIFFVIPAFFISLAFFGYFP